MKILSKYGIEIPKGEVADSPEMVRMITDQLGESLVGQLKVVDMYKELSLKSLH